MTPIGPRTSAPVQPSSPVIPGRWGRFVHRFRWPVLILSVLSLTAAVWLITQGVTFQHPAPPTTTESGQAVALIAAELPPRPVSFSLIFSHPTLPATAPEFTGEVERVLAPLRGDPRVARVAEPLAISRDGHHARAVVVLAGNRSETMSMAFPSAADVYPGLRALARSSVLEVVPAGSIALAHDFEMAAEKDLRRIEVLVLPLVLVLLLLVFGSLVAAALPLVVGVLALVAGFAGTVALSRVAPVSIYATNVMTMIGLGVAVDYSLFIVSRFREEIRQRPAADALARTMATAGHSVVFAGATVAVGLVGLTFLNIEGVASMALAGTFVVGFSVFYGVTFLPALLAILGARVDAGRLWFLRGDPGEGGRGLWHRVAMLVMARPWRVLIPLVVFLAVAASPFLHLRLASGDATSLPPGTESRRGEDLLREQFGDSDNRVIVVVRYPDGSVLRPERVAQLFDTSRWLAGRPHVTRVESLVDLDPRMTREQYQQLFSAPPAALGGARAVLEQSVGRHIVVLSVVTPFGADSPEARGLVETIRNAHPPVEGEVLVTGRTAFDVDLIGIVTREAWLVMAFVVVATYVVLLLLLGSVVLPLKAVVMNFLSISASYGALVWIFQDGHFARWLNFTPRPIEVVTPIVMFCVLFGLSMDYEVLLLSRIREEYERTGDNEQAVGAGLERTGRLITGAGAIMAGVFFGFGLADTVVIKAMGIGMGLAVVIDATLVRVLLVPATMKLLGEWNWWAPGFMRWRRGAKSRSATATPGRDERAGDLGGPSRPPM
jgi:RND superfamily putative drug exporter